METEYKLYPCCGDPSCPYCYGEGIVSGPEYDAFMEALEKLSADTFDKKKES